MRIVTEVTHILVYMSLELNLHFPSTILNDILRTVIYRNTVENIQRHNIMF